MITSYNQNEVTKATISLKFKNKFCFSGYLVKKDMGKIVNNTINPEIWGMGSGERGCLNMYLSRAQVLVKTHI